MLNYRDFMCDAIITILIAESWPSLRSTGMEVGMEKWKNSHLQDVSVKSFSLQKYTKSLTQYNIATWLAIKS